ncbi:MAG: DeoR/GlpR family DNA-binding transcription regulator [Bacteroidota bacterium]
MKPREVLAAELRKKYILNYLTRQDSIRVKEISSQCRVSEITARRDLTEMASEGLLVRTHGGAVRSENPVRLCDFDQKGMSHREEKIAICRLASSFIRENDTLYMDCGTTVYYMARFLSRFKNLRVITNSLPVVSDLMPYPQIKVYLIGGELDNSRKALYGPMTETLLERYKADKAFIGAGGVSLANGLSSVDEKEASITRKMAEAANEVYLLCDSSKLERDSYFSYSSLSLVTCLVTDSKAEAEILDTYKKNQINITTC